LKEVWRQLNGIGGGRSLGFGPNRVRSLPDGVARSLAEYLENSNAPSEEDEPADSHSGGNGYHLLDEIAANRDPLLETPIEPGLGIEHATDRIGDLCPECGQAAVVNEEGCRKCYACGYSEC